MSKDLRAVLSSFDKSTECFYEHDVSRAIHQLRDKDDVSEPPFEWLAEAMAFDFSEKRETSQDAQSTFFGPCSIFPNEDGSTREWPSRKGVTKDIIDYWSRRVEEVSHPILKARYAGLVWDLGNEIIGVSVNVRMAHIEIDSIIIIAELNCHRFECDTIDKLKHALSLSIRLNDSNRVEKVRDAILAYESKIAHDDKPGLWGFSYDLLIKKNKIPLSKDQEEKIITDLEDRLNRVSNSGEEARNPWAAQAAGMRLAKYYRAISRQDEVRRVLTKYGEIFVVKAQSCSAMVAMKWLQDLEQVYKQYGLNEEAQKILLEIRKLGPKAHGELKPLSGEVQIDTEEINKYIESMTEGELEKVLKRIIVRYIPRRNVVEREVKEMASEFVFSSIISTQIQDHKGRPIACIGPVHEDMDGRIILHITQNIQLESFFLRQIIQRAIDRHSIDCELLLEYIYRSPLFEDSKKDIFTMGLKAYLDGNALVAIHLLIPQIEDAVRNIIEHSGGIVLKPARIGGLHLRTMDELLRDENFVNVFGDDVALYFRVLFTDPRGLNLRNDVCHGMCTAAFFNMDLADRVFNALLILAQVRTQVSEDHEGNGSECDM